MQSISGNRARSAARVLFILTAAALFATAGCGLVHKDVPVSQTISVGGLMSLTSLTSADITAPLQAGAGDISSLSSVNLTFANLAEQTTGSNFSFITGGSIVLTGPAPLTSPITLGTLSAPGAVGAASYTIVNEPDLRPYLESSSGAISVSITYDTPPAPAQSILVTLNFHATL